MEPVDNVSKAMEILRRQMAENLDRLRRTGKLSARPASKSAAVANAASVSIQETVARKISAIDPRASDFDQRASSVLIESVLTTEFGETLLNGPAFHDLLREVQHTMLSDESIRAQLQTLLRALRTA